MEDFEKTTFSNQGDAKSEDLLAEQNYSSDNQNGNSTDNDTRKTAMIFGQSEEDIGKEYKEYKAFKLFRRVDADLTSIRDSENLRARIVDVLKFGFGNVIVNPRQVKETKKLLQNKNVGVYGAVCYPYGEELYGVKRVAKNK